jgi:Fe-S-cluster containining protein
MKIGQKVTTYFTEPSKCFIIKCKARCCQNAPLPEDFLPKYPDKLRRDIYSAVNIGRNDPRDTYNSIIYNTTPNPVQLVGFDQYGNQLMGIPQHVMEDLQIKSMEQVKALIEDSKNYKNYCPFLTDIGRCNVYENRPPICREFGTLPDKINQCPDKSSRLDIANFYMRDFCKFYKNLFIDVKQKFLGLFSKK